MYMFTYMFVYICLNIGKNEYKEYKHKHITVFCLRGEKNYFI